MKFTQIKTDKIDTTDKRFQISPFFSSGALNRSIQKVGVLNPPVLTVREEKYVIVSGWKRVRACQKLSFLCVPVFIMQDCSDLEAFKIPLFENLSHRDYSQVEVASVIEKLFGFGEKPEEIMKEYMCLLKVPPKRDVMDVYRKIHKLDDKIKEIGHQKEWSFGTLELMTELSLEEVQALYPLVKELSLNKQKQLIENMFEISRKNEVSVESLLGSGEFSRILAEENLSSVQKAERIHELARKMRNPFLSEWKESFEKISQSLDLPEEIKVLPSKYFEGDIVSIKLDIKNPTELKKSIEKLKELAERKEIHLLFKPYSND